MTRLADPARRLVIAHRGASIDAPENSLDAFARAVALGADAVELDVQLSGDGEAVVLHDATLDRTTRASGPVSAFGWSELGRLGVPRLADVMSAFPDAELLIEIKAVAAQAAVLRSIAEAGAEHRCVVGAADRRAVARFRGGPVPVCGGRSDIVRLRWRSALGLGIGGVDYEVLSVPRTHRGLPVATPGFIRAAVRAGVPVHVWTVDDPEQARALWAAGASGIVTNDPAAILVARD